MPIMTDADNINNDAKISSKNQDVAQEDLGEELEAMYRAGVHFGHSRSSRHPSMNPYLFGIRNNIEIFNLEKVIYCLERAVGFFEDLGDRGGQFLLVATKPEAKDIVERAGREFAVPYVVERWIGGTLTNFKVVRGQIDIFENLCRAKEAGEFSKYIKKEAVRLDKKLTKLEIRFSGLRALKKLPEAILIVDPKDERVVVREAQKTDIPIVAILNSDCDLRGIDYPVPGNDSASSSIQYLIDKLMEAYKRGIKSSATERGEKNKNEPV